MTLTISLLVTTLLCLAFASTRGIGIVGMFVLLNMHPLATAGALIVGGVAFYFYHLHKRSK